MSVGGSRAVAITGMGAISAMGEGAGALWQALRAGTSGIRPLRHAYAEELRVRIAAQVPESFDPAAHFPERLLPMLDRTAQFALFAANEAIAQSGLEFADAALAARCGVVVGTGVGGETTHDDQNRRLYAEQARRLHPLTIVRIMANAPASLISMAHGLHGPAFVVSSACASTNHAIAQAVMMIRAGMADVMLAGGADACLSFGVLRAWEAMRVLAGDDCRPFSANRRGLVLAEGAGMFVLESLAHAQARGAAILGVVAGVGMSADAGDIVSPDVAGGVAAMRLALADAGFEPAAIDYINAHGTGTPTNDASETRAIHEVFGAHARRLAISSTKSMHGHALGASGALELVAVLGAMRESLVPPTINLDAPDPECDLDYVPNQARPLPVAAALSNAFAFGGLNAVLALRAA
ncbi:MAG: beta-ketoacyl-[acyl-carrier-protein] synthase family protein [Gammaproteobacteria bacterium]|nr:beta-ketoacyl-[acyl-carrier-protein] synthase family protein [Gammaproteobacteria bacterium]